jgi:hypothetical protein
MVTDASKLLLIKVHYRKLLFTEIEAIGSGRMLNESVRRQLAVRPPMWLHSRILPPQTETLSHPPSCTTLYAAGAPGITRTEYQNSVL